MEQEKRIKSGKEIRSDRAGKAIHGSAKNGSGKSESNKNSSTKNDARNSDLRKKRPAENKKDLKENNSRTGKNDRSKKESMECPVYKKCGSCKYMDLDYEKHLSMKQKQVEGFLSKFCKVEKIHGMYHPYHYRNKVHAVFGRDKRGNIISGVYKEGTHDIVPVETCLIEDKKADEIIGTIRTLLKSFKIKTYDEDTGYGLFRYVLVRRGFKSGEIMVVLVIGSPVFPSKNNFVKALRKEHPEITTVVLNINDRTDSMILGDKEHVLYGKGYIEDTLCGLTFRISSKSFYQVNPVQTEALYKKAITLAGLTGKETVIDAYCGIGTIGLIASKDAKEVFGVELNRDAIRDAIANAKRNDIKNTRFYCADAGEFMVALANEGKSADVVIMDPPRSGSAEVFLDAVATLAPKKLVYVSCNPETLARDLEYLKKKGYQAGEAWPFDMFPWTGHVETVVLLERKVR